MTLYRYGWTSWIWRIIIFLFLGSGGFLAVLGIRQESWLLCFMGLPLVLPALFFGAIVAARVDLENDELRIATLIFWQRRIHRSRLGRPEYRSHAYDESGAIFAPRLWIPIERGLPIHLDLLGTIPDPVEFRGVFKSRLPRVE